MKNNDTNFCSLMAYALITGNDYTQAEKILREDYGRRKRRGMWPQTLRQAIKDDGFTLTQLRGCAAWPNDTLVDGQWVNTSDTPIRRAFDKAKTALTMGVFLKKHMPQATVLVHYAHHVGVFINGINHDWTNGRRHRVLTAYLVEKDVSA